MHLADRCFPALVAEPRFVEALLIPFHHDGKPIGTVWVVSHSLDRKFDREDERVVRVLSRFASAGWQLWKAYEAVDEIIRRKDDLLATLDRRVAERTGELSASNAQLTLALAERGALERARTEWLATLMAAQEDERRRVAREPHDELGRHISGLVLGLHILKAGSPDHLDGLVRRLQALVSDIDRAVRRLARDLRPAALDDLGMTVAIRSHVDEWSQQTGIAADFFSRDCEERCRRPSKPRCTASCRRPSRISHATRRREVSASSSSAVPIVSWRSSRTMGAGLMSTVLTPTDSRISG